MKKIIFLLVLSLLFVACDQEKETLTFRITWKAYSGRGEAISKVIENFNKTLDDYQVLLVSGDEDQASIAQSLETSEHDLYVLPYRYVQHFGHEGALKTLTNKTDDLYTDLISLGHVDGGFYGMPWLSHSMALIYNKDLLQASGVDVESIKDRTSFIAALEKVKAQGHVGIGLVGAEHNDVSWMVNQFVYGQGGQLASDRVLMNSPETKKAISFYRDTLGQYAQDKWQEEDGSHVMDHFRRGQLAFEIQSLWGITDIWKNGGNFEVGVMSLETIGACSEVGPMMLSYDKDLSEDKEVVVKSLIDYMTSYEVQKTLFNGEYSPERNEYYPFRLPVRSDILSDEAFSKYQMFEVFLDSYAIKSIDVPVPRWMIIKETLITPGLHQVMMSERTIDDFLEDVETRGNDILGGNDE